MPPHVFHLVFNLIRGGTEGQCARVAMHFARMGHQHRVGVSKAEGFFLDAVEQACGPVYRMNIRRVLSLQTWREIRRLAGFLREGRFDLLHAWDADAAIFGSIAARLVGLPIITSQRDLGEIYSWWKWRLMLHAHRRADRVVVNASSIRSLLAGKGVPESRLRWIRNLIDLEEFDRLHALPFSRAAELPPHPRIAAVARLDPEKDTGTLLRAVRLLKDADLHVSAVLAGDGVERVSLCEQARLIEITDRVYFLGDTLDIPALLGKVDMGVLTPRRNEGLSNTILEYMAAGLPVVATDCGGNRELVDEGQTGFLVCPGDADSLASRLRQLLQDPCVRIDMGRKARNRVEEKFSSSTILEKFEELYREQGIVSKDRPRWRS